MWKPLIPLLIVAPAAVVCVASTARLSQIQHPSEIATQQIKPGAVESSLEREKLQLEKQRLDSDNDIEQKKLRLEQEKLQIEKSTSRWQTISGVIPLVVALGTLIFSIWSFGKQSRQQTALQFDAAKLQFEIKAAEIAFSGKTPKAVSNRAKLLKTVFPNRLPDNFATNFEPAEYGGKEEPPDEKKLFLDLLLKYPQCRAEIFNFWLTLFPGDSGWLSRIEPSVKAGAVDSRQGPAVPPETKEPAAS